MSADPENTRRAPDVSARLDADLREQLAKTVAPEDIEAAVVALRAVTDDAVRQLKAARSHANGTSTRHDDAAQTIRRQ